MQSLYVRASEIYLLSVWVVLWYAYGDLIMRKQVLYLMDLYIMSKGVFLVLARKKSTFANKHMEPIGDVYIICM